MAALIFCFIALLVPSPASALCAMCRKSLEEGNPGFIQGIYWSILLLVSLPLIIFTVCAYQYFQLKKREGLSE